MKTKKNNNKILQQEKIAASSAQTQRFSKFFQELSHEKLKYSSVESHPIFLTKGMNKTLFDSRDSKSPPTEFLSTDYLTHSVLDILNKRSLDKKPPEIAVFFSENTHVEKVGDIKLRTQEAIKELSSIELQIMRKRVDLGELNICLKNEEKKHNRKTVTIENDYNKITAQNMSNEDLMIKIEKEIEEIKCLIPEESEYYKILLQSRADVEAKEKQALNGGKEKREKIIAELKALKEENEENEIKILSIEEEIEKYLSFNVNTANMKLERKEKELVEINEENEALESAIQEKESIIERKIQDFEKKLSQIESEITLTESKIQKYLEEKEKECYKMNEILQNKQNELENVGVETQRNDREKLISYQEAKEKLKDAIKKKKEDLLISKENLLKDLETKSYLIKQNNERLSELNLEYEKLEKNLKDIDGFSEKNKSNILKKLESKKQKNKMLKNLFHNMPKNRSHSIERKKTNFIKKSMEEKTVLQQELERISNYNEAIMNYQEDFKENNEEILIQQLDIQNLENEMEKLRKIFKQKQEIFQQSKEIQEKLKQQMASLK